MARIYRQVGSLTQLMDELEREGIGAFSTIGEIRTFRNNCRSLLQNELERLRGALAGNQERNILTRLFFFFGKFWKKRYIEKQKRILSVFRRHKYLFYGAEGEERVSRELSNLPDTYTVINDYRLEFSPPVYDRNNDDRIYSIQVDHVVVGPTGLYLVETKNWSRDSVENVELFSPIRQLKRSNFAIFVLLNQAVEGGDIDNFSNHWGDRRISPKNILCLINHRPTQEFQYVKTLSEHQITHYVGNQRQTFSQMEVKSLAEYLLSRVT